jgi:RNA polymerase sigma-70 factor, ECF subfamily
MLPPESTNAVSRVQAAFCGPIAGRGSIPPNEAIPEINADRPCVEPPARRHKKGFFKAPAPDFFEPLPRFPVYLFGTPKWSLDLNDRIETWILHWLSKGGDRGREIAFDRIWKRYHRRMLFFVRQRAPADAEDLVQDIFLKVYHGLDGYDPSRPFVSWIYAIARNHCINHAAKKKPALRRMPEIHDTEGAFAGSENPESRLLDGEQTLAIDAALAQLDEESREMAFLRYYEGLKTRQIASVFGIAEGTVKSRLFNIRRQIRKELASYED